ncbi:MAG: RidA family protein [Pseudomonadota bacterium]
MAIRRIGSGGIYEDKAAYCRAVVAGGFVHVAGTTAQGETIPETMAGQCRSALETIKAALAEAGSGFEHVVRVKYYLPDVSQFESCYPVLREYFGANPPAATMLECNLIDPKYLIEIELTAIAGEDAE